MILQHVIDLARYSEVAGTSIKDNTAAIILFINAGMLELYKRFPVNTKEHIIPLVDGTTTYALPSDFMYVLSAFEELPEGSETIASEIPINDEHDPKSIFLPNHTEVQVPLVADNSYISLIYIPKPPSYTEADLNTEIDIPETLIDCLLHYVGYKAYLGIRSDGQSENNAHYLRFERSCDRARELGVSHPLDSLQAPRKLADRGFV